MNINHIFQTGFKVWHIVAPASIIVAAIIDAMEQVQFSLGWDGVSASHTLIWCHRRQRKVNDSLFWSKLFVLLLSTSVFMMLFYRESWKDLHQAFQLLQQNSFVAFVAAAAVFAGVFVAFVIILLVVLDCGHLAVVFAVLLFNIGCITVHTICDAIHATAYVADHFYENFRPQLRAHTDDDDEF